jgi:hypothetical protein
VSAAQFTADEAAALDFMRRDTLRDCLGPKATKARKAIEAGHGQLGSGAVSVPQALHAMQVYAERLITSLEHRAALAKARGDQ